MQMEGTPNINDGCLSPTLLRGNRARRAERVCCSVCLPRSRISAGCCYSCTWRFLRSRTDSARDSSTEHHRQRFHRNVTECFAKYPLPAFIQSVATAAPSHSSKQVLHSFDPLQLRRKLREFLSRQVSPSLGCRNVIAKTEEQLPDFIQREACLPRPLYDREPMEHSVVVAPLTTDPLSRKKHADPFVITDRGRSESKLSSDFRVNCGMCRILKQPNLDLLL
jgi:hypothetical protein